MLVNLLCVSRGMEVRKVSNSKGDLQGHWQWCHSIGHVRFPAGNFRVIELNSIAVLRKVVTSNNVYNSITVTFYHAMLSYRDICCHHISDRLSVCQSVCHKSGVPQRWLNPASCK